MDIPEATITVIESNECSVYMPEDEFDLSGRILHPPYGKPVCLTLANDITEKIKDWNKLGKHQTLDESLFWFNCSGLKTGCTGMVRVRCRKEHRIIFHDEDPSEHEIDTISSMLSEFPIFRTLERYHIKELVPLLKMKKFAKGDYIIKKGEPGINVFIIVSGRVEVMDDNINIAILERGEVFGEMSHLSGDPVGATIRAIEPAWVIFINGKHFKELLRKFPSLQMYFARLLAKRLAKTNAARSEEVASGMVGRLSEIPPAELCQIFYQNQKTGILNLRLSEGTAALSFREGKIITARCRNKVGQEAFYETLKEKEGRFQFKPGLPPDQEQSDPLGDFMWMLMSGLNRIDEGS